MRSVAEWRRLTFNPLLFSNSCKKMKKGKVFNLWNWPLSDWKCICYLYTSCVKMLHSEDYANQRETFDAVFFQLNLWSYHSTVWASVPWNQKDFWGKLMLRQISEQLVMLGVLWSHSRGVTDESEWKLFKLYNPVKEFDHRWGNDGHFEVGTAGIQVSSLSQRETHLNQLKGWEKVANVLLFKINR